MKITVTKEEHLQLINWQRAFQKADNIRILAYQLRYIVPHETLDKRVNTAWAKVKESEPFPTFERGELVNKAGYLLSLIKLSKVVPGIITVI